MMSVSPSWAISSVEDALPPTTGSSPAASATPASRLDKEYAVVGCRRVTDLVHTLDDGVKRRVITDCGVRAVKVIVNRAWQTDDRDVIFPGEILRPRKGSVASDNDQRVNSELHEIVVGLLASFHRHELLAAGGLQNRSAPLDSLSR